MVLKFRSVYNQADRLRVQHTFIPKNKTDQRFIDHTKQSFAAACDVNNIVNSHPNLDPNSISESQLQGILNNPDLYSDYDSELDFAAALNVVNRAKEQFDTLPSELRRRFKEDPYEFLSYVNNKDNYSEMKKFGLLKEDITDQKPFGPVISADKIAETQSQQVIEPTPLDT